MYVPGLGSAVLLVTTHPGTLGGTKNPYIPAPRVKGVGAWRQLTYQYLGNQRHPLGTDLRSVTIR